jgi:hypothetical protein
LPRVYAAGSAWRPFERGSAAGIRALTASASIIARVTTTIPRDPLGRFLAIAAELVAHKRWWEGPTIVRYAALPLLTASGTSAEVARRVDAEGTALVAQQGWFSDLRGGMRFLVAAWLVAAGRDPRRFTAACEAIRARFRAAGVRRGGAYEVVAATMLHVASAGDERTVRRLQAIYEMMRQHHWWLTGPDDLPACALLALRPEGLPELEARIEGIYSRLRDRGLAAGSGLQMASHIACTAEGSESRPRRPCAPWSSIAPGSRRSCGSRGRPSTSPSPAAPRSSPHTAAARSTPPRRATWTWPRSPWRRTPPASTRPPSSRAAPDREQRATRERLPKRPPAGPSGANPRWLPARMTIDRPRSSP